MRRKDMADRAVMNRLQQATENGVWLTDIPQRHNGTKLSSEELQDNLLLRYDIVPLKLPTECDGYGKKLLMTHSLS